MTHGEPAGVLFLLCLSNVIVEVLEQAGDVLVLLRVERSARIALAFPQFGNVRLGLQPRLEQERVMRSLRRDGREVTEVVGCAEGARRLDGRRTEWRADVGFERSRLVFSRGRDGILDGREGWGTRRSRQALVRAVLALLRLERVLDSWNRHDAPCHSVWTERKWWRTRRAVRADRVGESLISRDLTEHSERSLPDWTSPAYLIGKATTAENALPTAAPAQYRLLTCAISRFHFGVAVQI